MNQHRSEFTYDGSYLEFIIERTEQVHALVNRYTSPDEEAFFPDRISNAALLQAQNYPPVLHPNTININKKLLSIYTNRIVPGLCENGDDRQYGSSAVCDTVVLQALSRRIHYGKFVAEAKFAADKENYTKHIEKQDADWLMEALTVKRVEEMVLSRVELKASTYGRDPRDSSDDAKLKVDPKTIRALYADWVMPLTKEVELEYLLQRVSGPRVSFSGKNSPSHEVAAILASRDSSSNKGVLISYVFVLDLNRISNNLSISRYDSDKSAIQAVLSNHTSYGIVPLIDAFGVIRQSRTLLCSNENLSVCGVISHRHKFQLVARGSLSENNTSLWTRVQTIYADDFAIQCCTSWVEIHAPQAKIVRVQDSLNRLSREQDKDEKGGIAAAFVLTFQDQDDVDEKKEDRKLSILAQVSGPSTVVRHAVVSKHCGIPSGHDRTLLQFAVRDETGSLNEVLQIFSRHRINLQLIESYPVTTKVSHSPSLKRRSMFFVECDGHQDDDAVANALSDLKKSTVSLRVIGSYPYEELKFS